MSSIAVSLIVFACVFGGALLGVALRSILPPQHLTSESKEIVRLGMGLVGTIAALVLGLLVASAKSSYDTQSAEVTQLAANVGALDRVLAHYGPETKETRDLLRSTVISVVDRIWPEDHSRRAGLAPTATAESVVDKLQQLSPKNDAQRSLQLQALSISGSALQSRWLMYEQSSNSVPVPLLVVLVLWLTVIFISFGLFAPVNVTAIASLFFSALSASCAVFLILEMYRPYDGLIQISSASLRLVLTHLGN